MSKESLEEERPSIIQEIVFYDKPNIRPMIFDEILPVATSVRRGKGDIVISRAKRSSSPNISFLSKQKPKNSDVDSFESSDHESEIQGIKNLKNKSSQHKNILAPADDEKSELATKPLKNKQKRQKSPPPSIDSLNHFFDYEELVDVLESGDTTKKTLEKTDESNKVLIKKEAPEENTESLDIVEGQVEEIETVNKVKKGSKSDDIVEKPSTSTAETPQKRRESTREKRPTEKKLLLNEDMKKSAKAPSVENKVSPFKMPKKPVKKGAVKSQTTLLNYVTINSKDSAPKSNLPEEKVARSTKKNSPTKETRVEEQEKNESPKLTSKSDSKGPKSQQKPKNSNQTAAKKPRGRNKKTENDKSTSENQYSDEEVSFKSPEKNRRIKSETNVSVDSNSLSGKSKVSTDNLKELLDDAQEQVRALDRVEEELQNMFTNEEGEEGETKQSKSKRKPGRKPKMPGPAKRIKKEIEEVTEESTDTLDVPEKVPITEGLAEEYGGSDEDSRGEWIPVEYAEYKQQHKMKQMNKYSCKFCLKVFPTYYGMRKHRALEHNDLGKSRKEATYREDVRLKQEHDEESDEESRDEWMPQDYADYKLKHKMNKMKRVLWYKCKICCAVFPNYYKLSKHRLEHQSNPTPYECKECTDTFRDVESLMVHIRIHQGKDPYSCKKCDKGFQTKEELENHMPIHVLKKGPTPPKRFRCDICFKEFVKLCDIERHTRVHTGEKPCECNICHKRFQQSHNLSKHLLTHLHVKPFQCDICHKKFGRIDILNRHLLTHSLEKPFNCKFCDKGFIRQVQLDNHMEKNHSQAQRKNPKEERIETGSVHLNDDQDENVDDDLDESV